MVGFSSGPSGGEQLQFIVDIVTGDQSGIDSLDQLKARVLQLDQVLKAQTKSAQESYQAFQQMGRIDASSWHGALPAMTELERVTKSAKDSFKDFADQGLTSTTKAINENSTGISKWLVNAGNIHGIFSNMQGALANLNPAFQVLGQSIQEVGFGIAGIAQGGLGAAFGVANIAAAAFKTFTDLGKASGDFYNEMRTGAAVMGMTEQQTYTLRTAMELSGASVGQLQIFIQRLTKAQEDLASGTDNVASRALRKLNVAVVDNNGNLRSSYDLLIDVQRALAAMTNEQERNALTSELAGMRSREVNALMRDFNLTLDQSKDLLKEHGDLFVDIDKKQNAYNLQQAKMKIQWAEITNSVGPSYNDMLKHISDAAEAVGNAFTALNDGPMGRFTSMVGLAASNLAALLSGMLQVQGIASAFAGLFGFGGSKAPTGKFVDTEDSWGGPGSIAGKSSTATVTDARAREIWRLQHPNEEDPWAKDSAPYDIDKFKPKGGTGPATGYSGLMAQQLDLPAARAAFDQFTQGFRGAGGPDFGKGNIDLNSLPKIKNADGSTSTVRSIGVELDGITYLIPTAIDGKIVGNDAAIEAFKQTGRYLGKFASEEEATQYAVELHNKEAAKLDMPRDFIFSAQKGKATINEWTMANKEWDEVLQKVRLEELRTKIAITDLRLAGDHSSQTFLDMEARLTGLGEAETYLSMKRHEALDGYSVDIEALRQSMQNARQVTRALVIDIQGHSTPQGRSQIAKDAVGNDFMTQMVGSRQAPGGSIQFHNHGVVTTPEVADWFAQMLSAMQRAGRTQLSGT